MLVLGDQRRHALDVGSHSGLLGLLGGPGVLGDQVGVGAAEVGHGPGHGGAVREVVVEVTDGAGSTREHLLPLGQQQRVQGLKYRKLLNTDMVSSSAFRNFTLIGLRRAGLDCLMGLRGACLTA